MYNYATHNTKVIATFTLEVHILIHFSQLPIDEQANNVEEIVSNPTDVDAETFTVAAEIVANLLRNMDTNNASVVC